MRKQFYAILIAGITVMSATGFAQNGVCGDNLTWRISRDTLYIEGKGAMTDYKSDVSPFSLYYSFIRVLNLSDSITHIGDNAFSGLWLRSIRPIKLANTTSTNGTVLGGTIGAGAFSGSSAPPNTSISITIENVGEIGDNAFSRFQGLSSINLKMGNYNPRYSGGWIGNNAFSGCTNLSSVTLDNVRNLSSSSFSGCTSLSSITLPRSFSGVTSPGNNPFSGCTALTSIGVDSENTNFTSEDGVLFSKDKTRLYLYPAGKQGAYTIPNDVTYIDSYAFYDCTGLTSITLSEGLTNIQNGTFRGCSNLTSIKVPASITNIESSAFGDCKNLASIEVDNDNPNYCAVDGIVFSKDKRVLAIYPAGKQGLSYRIPNSVDSIGVYAFSGCTKLTSVTIPGTVTSFGSGIFRGCTNLVSIAVEHETPIALTDDVFSTYWHAILRVPAGTVDAYAAANVWKNFGVIKETGDLSPVCFSGTAKQSETDSIHWQLCLEDSTLIVGGKGTLYSGWLSNKASAIKTAIIETGITGIGDFAFSGCSGLTSVTIPESVTNIGRYAFNGCRSLTSVIIPQGVTSIEMGAFLHCSSLISVTIPNSVTSIETNAFSGCSNLASVAIPSSVIRIGDYTFQDCRSLTSVIIPSSITSIEMGAFLLCSSLISVTIPESVTSIGSSAFYNCTNLTSVTIPNSVTTIGNNAFSGCSSLTSVTIPQSVTSIGGSAFSNCTNLTSIEVDNNNPNYSSNGGVLFDKNEINLLCCPAGKRGKYSIPNGVTGIGSGAFSNCTNLTSVTIPNSVTTIGNNAFSDCSSLTSVTIPCGVTTIGNFAFYKCKNLSEIYNRSALPQFINSTVFEEVDQQNCRLYVPTGSLPAYRAEPVWQNFATIEEESTMAEATQNTVTIEWYPVDNAVSYTVVIYADAEKTRIIAVINIPATATQSSKLRSITANIFSCTVEDLQPDTAYWYDIEAKDEEGQTFETVSGDFSTQATSGMNELKLNEINIFPNPAKDKISIESDATIQKIEILDLSGRTVKTWRAASLQKGVQTINVSELPIGVYLLKIYTDKELITKRFVKE